jgi:hypothetical protein
MCIRERLTSKQTLKCPIEIEIVSVRLSVKTVSMILSCLSLCFLYFFFYVFISKWREIIVNL